MSDSLWPKESLDCSIPGLPVHHQLPELAQTHVNPVSDAIQSSHPLPPTFHSMKVFSSKSVLCIRWPKDWNVNISPSNEYSGLISFRIDWFDLLADWGTHKSLLQHHSSKASILQCSSFFMVQLSHPYITTRKARVLTIWTFVTKVSLLFSILSRLITSFCIWGYWYFSQQYWSQLVLHPAWHFAWCTFLGEISITSDMQMTPPLWQKVKKN